MPDAILLPSNIATPQSSVRTARGGLDLATYLKLKSSIHRYLVSNPELDQLPDDPDEQTRDRVLAFIQGVVGRAKLPLDAVDRQKLSLEILHELFGLGPLEPLMQDPAVTDILVNGTGEVYVERGGVLEETVTMFKDNAHLMRIINKIITTAGRRINKSCPIVDARLADGSRVHVILPPLAVDGPHLSIRRFGHTPISEADLLANQTLSPEMLVLLKATVAARLEYPHFGRHWGRQDHVAQCALCIHAAEGTDRHD